MSCATKFIQLDSNKNEQHFITSKHVHVTHREIIHGKTKFFYDQNICWQTNARPKVNTKKTKVTPSSQSPRKPYTQNHPSDRTTSHNLHSSDRNRKLDDRSTPLSSRHDATGGCPRATVPQPARAAVALRQCARARAYARSRSAPVLVRVVLLCHTCLGLCLRRPFVSQRTLRSPRTPNT